MGIQSLVLLYRVVFMLYSSRDGCQRMVVEGVVGAVGSRISDRDAHHLTDLGGFAVFLELADIWACHG